MALRKLQKFKEEDLYDPLRKWLVNNGYDVQAEVQACDVVAIKDDEITVIELKKAFNLKLVYQCMERQKIGKYVYAAPPKKIHERKREYSKNSKTPAQLIKLGAPPNTGTILRMNHYGWFHKIARARYTFDVDMAEIREEFSDVVDFFTQQIEN